MIGLLLVILPSSLLGELESLDRELASAQHVLQRIDRERAVLDDAIATLQAERADTTLQLHAAKSQLRRRLYRWSRLPPRTLFLADPTTLRERLAYSQTVRWVAHHDRRGHDEVRRADTLLAHLEDELRGKRARHAELFKEAQEQRAATASARAKKRSWYTHAAPHTAQLAREAEQARSVLTQRLGTSPGGGLARHFPWPVRGRIVLPFGRTKDARTPTWTSQYGVGIEAPFGDPVRAVAAGTVAYAGWVAGYGQTVVIDHGGGEHTLYAQLGRMDVAERQQVAAEDIIGSIGDSGEHPQPMLYFETRKQGRSIDPTGRFSD